MSDALYKVEPAILTPAEAIALASKLLQFATQAVRP